MNRDDDAPTSTGAAQTTSRHTGPPHDPPSAAVAAAEQVAEACWRLARVLSAAEMPPEAVHQVAARLLGAADALGVVARATTGDTSNGEAEVHGTAFPWRAADQGLASVFHHLYLSIPDDHPARQWFIRYAEEQ